GAPEQASYLLRGCGGCKVPVKVPDPQQCVAHGAAYTPGLVPGFLQTSRDTVNGARRAGLVPAGSLFGYPQSTLPPFTLRISPVMWRAIGVHRKTMGPATSSAVATRPSGIPALAAARASVRRTEAERSVSTQPGATLFTVIPRGASSTHMDLTSETMAPLDAA